MELASVVIYVNDADVERTVVFYERALGLQRRFYDPEYPFAELTGSGTTTLAIAGHRAGERLMPGRYAPPAQGDGHAAVEVAFTTADVRAAFVRAVAAGADVLAAPAMLPWGQEVAYVRAPDGTLLGLCAPRPAS